MATVEPFHGIRYNPEKIASLAEVVTPPYDVISQHQQASYYDRSPYNIIRLELGRSLPDDNETQNAHTRARDHLREWQSREVLIRDAEAAYYLVATNYAAEEAPRTRWGLIAQVGLEPFGPEGHILPHEQTFPQIKTERLGLMQACGLNTSPIRILALRTPSSSTFWVESSHSRQTSAIKSSPGSVVSSTGPGPVFP